jgi:hypothetical protein
MVMKYNYLIYFVRVNAGNTVGQGNRFKELDHEITKEDVEEIYKEIDEESKEFFNVRIQSSKALIANIIKLG